MRTIEIDIEHPPTEIDGGKTGEHNAACLVFHLPQSCFGENTRFFAAVSDGNRPDFRTQYLESDPVLCTVSLPLPHYITEKFLCRLELTAENWGGEKVQSLEKICSLRLRFAPSPDGGCGFDGEMESPVSRLLRAVESGELPFDETTLNSLKTGFSELSDRAAELETELADAALLLQKSDDAAVFYSQKSGRSFALTQSDAVKLLLISRDGLSEASPLNIDIASVNIRITENTGIGSTSGGGIFDLLLPYEIETVYGLSGDFFGVVSSSDELSGDIPDGKKGLVYYDENAHKLQFKIMQKSANDFKRVLMIYPLYLQCDLSFEAAQEELPFEIFVTDDTAVFADSDFTLTYTAPPGAAVTALKAETAAACAKTEIAVDDYFSTEEDVEEGSVSELGGRISAKLYLPYVDASDYYVFIGTVSEDFLPDGRFAFSAVATFADGQQIYPGYIDTDGSVYICNDTEEPLEELWLHFDYMKKEEND